MPNDVEPGENTPDPNVGEAWWMLRRHVNALAGAVVTLNSVTSVPPGDAGYVTSQKGPHAYGPIVDDALREIITIATEARTIRQRLA